jgi:hypothetical protein
VNIVLSAISNSFRNVSGNEEIGMSSVSVSKSGAGLAVALKRNHSA